MIIFDMILDEVKIPSNVRLKRVNLFDKNDSSVDELKSLKTLIDCILIELHN